MGTFDFNNFFTSVIDMIAAALFVFMFIFSTVPDVWACLGGGPPYLYEQKPNSEKYEDYERFFRQLPQIVSFLLLVLFIVDVVIGISVSLLESSVTLGLFFVACVILGQAVLLFFLIGITFLVTKIYARKLKEKI